MLVSLEVPFFRAFSVRAVSTVRGWPLPQILALSISTSVPARRRMPCLLPPLPTRMRFFNTGWATGVAASVSYLLDESETDSQSHIDQDMFILEAKENFGSKGAKEAQEVLGRVNSLFAGGELDEDAKDVFFQAIMSVYMDSKKTAREKYTPKKYRKHKDKE